MNWIERYLNISPDGGNGYVEWLILAYIVFLAVRLLRPRVRRRQLRLRSRQGDQLG